jgi:hypothetical protein
VRSKVREIQDVLSGRKNDPDLRKNYEKMAETFGVSVEDLATFTPREFAIRATEARGNARMQLLGEAEIVEQPRVDGNRCALALRLANGRSMVCWLVWEEEGWSISLGGEPPR